MRNDHMGVRPMGKFNYAKNFGVTSLDPNCIKNSLIPSLRRHRMNVHSATLVPKDDNPVASEEKSLIKKLSFFDRFLALWIFLAIVIGIILGYFVPSTQNVLQSAGLVGVSAPIGNFQCYGC